jgi:predicted acetyltransferase
MSNHLPTSEPETHRPPLELIRPSLDLLPDYVAALKRGWSPDNVRHDSAAREELERIKADPKLFVAQLDDPESKGGPVTLLDGSIVPRLPGFCRWLWDGEFCGRIGFRWQPGTSTLPPHVLGHMGFTVVPWKRRHGYATRALGLLLREVADKGLTFVELTTDPDNVASQRVILANGGQLVERFKKPAAYGGNEAYRFRINL